MTTFIQRIEINNLILFPIGGSQSRGNGEGSNDGDDYGKTTVQKINKQPKDSNSSKNKYTLQFFQESKEEIMKRKEQARSTLETLSLKDQEVSDDYFPPEIDIPKRPPWDFNMSKEQLELREQKYFTVSYLHYHLYLFSYGFRVG